MICKKCGKTIPDSASICPYCLDVKRKGIKAGSTNQETEKIPTQHYVPQQTAGESKTVVGVLMALFLGLIGLIIGLLLYPTYTVERETFIKGWVSTFIFVVLVAIICVGFVTCVAIAKIR